MAVLSLNEPLVLSINILERTITRKSAGVYVLSAVEDGVADTRYVGRSSDDVGARLKEYVGLYSRFAFAYASSPKNAYEIYHSIKPPENTDHPAKPVDADWVCPVCGR